MNEEYKTVVKGGDISAQVRVEVCVPSPSELTGEEPPCPGTASHQLLSEAEQGVGHQLCSCAWPALPSSLHCSSPDCQQDFITFIRARSCGCPLPEGAQGQVGCGSEQSGLVEKVSARGRRMEQDV